MENIFWKKIPTGQTEPKDPQKKQDTIEQTITETK